MLVITGQNRLVARREAFVLRLENLLALPWRKLAPEAGAGVGVAQIALPAGAFGKDRIGKRIGAAAPGFALLFALLEFRDKGLQVGDDLLLHDLRRIRRVELSEQFGRLSHAAGNSRERVLVD